MAYTTIDDPSAHFQIALYTGNNNTSQTITNGGNSDLQPDWIWIKNRDDVEQHHLMDSSRGANKFLHSNATDDERTGSYNGGHNAINTINSDGFTITSNGSNDELNFGTRTYVAWQWKCNGGSTTSFSASGAQLAGTRQSNTTAGFSIITYTGDGNNNATIPHGLSSAPKWVVIKDRGNATNWYVGHKSLFTTGEIFLNLQNAVAAAFGPFNKTAPTASNIVLGTDGNVNGSNDTMICYAFAEVQGYSKFGSYKGNGESNGAFIYTGFQPAWIMLKRSDSSTNGDFAIYDNKRSNIGNGDNENNEFIRANDNAVEASASGLDILSNGVKIRSTSSRVNANDSTYVYMAFAEHPFVSSKGVPTTAK